MELALGGSICTAMAGEELWQNFSLAISRLSDGWYCQWNSLNFFFAISLLVVLLGGTPNGQLPFVQSKEASLAPNPPTDCAPHHRCHFVCFSIVCHILFASFCKSH